MAGTDFTQTALEDPAPVIILVEPQLPENIGMAARAMANFGLSELRLVRPREAFPCERAYANSAKAHHIIDRARLYDDLSQAVADMTYVCATTARPRYSFKQVLPPVEAMQILRKHIETGQRAAILFGRERFGLSNEEISLSDDMVTFPVNPAFASLNIAQAVLLMAHEWLQSKQMIVPHSVSVTPMASKGDLHGLFAQLEQALSSRGYFRPPARKKVMVDNLRAVLTKAQFNEAEIRLLRGVISSLDRFSPAHPRGAGAPIASARENPVGIERDKDER